MGRKRYKEDIFTIEELKSLLIGQNLTLIEERYGIVIRGNNLMGIIVNPGSYSINPVISIDHKRCFDKFQRSPIIIELPLSSEFFMERVNRLLNDYNKSNTYSWDKDYYRHPGKDDLGRNK